jgi:aryl-alcohol dehydrogenase-like predicted oxidoreductase
MPQSTRREFLTTTAASLAALPLVGEAATSADATQEETAKALIPRRPLGKTGMNVSVLGMGCGSQFLSVGSDEATTALVHAAIDGGINYLDSAWEYGNGKSLQKLGIALADGNRRKKVYVTSKTQRRDRDGALREIESSLKNLQTDYIDLFQIHLITPNEDIEKLLGKDGVYQALLEQKDQKVIRNVGITGHLAARNMKTLIERMERLDTVLCPVNPKKDSRHYLRTYDDANPDGHFEEIVLPAARKRGLGIIAMKVTAQGQLIGTGPGKADVATLFRWAASEPGVCTCIIGPGSLANLRQNIETAQRFTPLPEEERTKLALHINQGPPRRFAYQHPDYRDA